MRSGRAVRTSRPSMVSSSWGASFSTRAAPRGHKLVELRPKLFLTRAALHARHLRQNLLGYMIPLPARHCARDVDLLPLRLKGRLLELSELPEIRFDKASNPLIAVTGLLPVENSQNGCHSNRRNGPTLWDEIGIVYRVQSAWNVVVRQPGVILNRKKVEPRFWLEPGKQIIGLANHVHNGRDLTTAHLLQSNSIVDEHRLDGDAQPLEHNLSRQIGGATSCVEPHPAPFELFKRVKLPSGIDVHLSKVQRRDVLDAILDIRDLEIAAEVVKDIGLGDCDINSPQVEEVIDVSNRTVCDKRKNTKVVAVIENFGEVSGIPNKGPLK